MSERTDRVEGCRVAHARLLLLVEGVTEATVRAPSRLVGWTVAQVLAHLANHADSHASMFEAAQHGQVATQYPGGYAQRVADIGAKALESRDNLVAGVRQSTARLEAAWIATAEDVWVVGRGRIAVLGALTLDELVFLRWREVEVHSADLDVGGSWEDWSDAYVQRELVRAVEGLHDRLDTAGRRQLLAWLLDRSMPAGWPVLQPWLRDPTS